MAGLTHWEGEPLEVWKRLWALDGLEIHDTLGSTNDRAKELAREGSLGWWLVLAQEQTRGRGRGEKEWHSAPSMSLLFSLLMPGEGASWSSLLPLRMGMAVARGLEAAWKGAGVSTPPKIEVKWPNDLVLKGRKLAGILCEGGGVGRLVAGVGINLRQRPEDFPPALVPGAISVEMALGRVVSRSAILTEVLSRVRGGLAEKGDTLSAKELEEYGARDHLYGKELWSELEGRGIGGGLTPQGHLKLLLADGGHRIVRAGSVRAVPGSGSNHGASG